MQRAAETHCLHEERARVTSTLGPAIETKVEGGGKRGGAACVRGKPTDHMNEASIHACL